MPVVAHWGVISASFYACGSTLGGLYQRLSVPGKGSSKRPLSSHGGGNFSIISMLFITLTLIMRDYVCKSVLKFGFPVADQLPV
jgi:hypothetical protein